LELKVGQGRWELDQIEENCTMKLEGGQGAAFSENCGVEDGLDWASEINSLLKLVPRDPGELLEGPKARRECSFKLCGDWLP
jgi:hypothetical protein